VPWFERIPGLDTMAGRRAAGTDLFNALNARGEFNAAALNYHGLSLRNFSAHAEISKRELRVAGANYRLSSGRGQASAHIDFSSTIPHLSAGFQIQGLHVENWASHLPPQLGDARGSADFGGLFSSEGNSRAQLESNLEGRAELRLNGLEFGRFDPLRGAAQLAAWGDLAPTRTPISLRSAHLVLRVKDRHAELEPVRFELGGAVFDLAGACSFDGSAHFESNADLRRVNRHWLTDPDSDSDRTGRFLLSGDLNALRATIEDPSAQARR
jgi:hypothetical protein